MGKKEVELIRRFLQFMGYRILSLTVREKPDAQATVEKDGRQLLLGIEHTQYHVDTPPGATGGSPGAKLASFWGEVQERLECLQESFKLPVDCRVRLHNDMEPRMNEAPHLADQLVRLAKKELETAIPNRGDSVEYNIRKRGEPKPIKKATPNGGQRVYINRLPDGYPLLQKYVRSLEIKNVVDSGVLFAWPCANTSVANVGVDPRHVATAVRNKAREASHYDWGDAKEKWLVICAHGSPIVSNAGPLPELVDWQRADLTQDCQSSRFDRIFFYQSLYPWCQPIWPFGPAVKRDRNGAL